MAHEFQVGLFLVRYVRSELWQNFHMTTGWSDDILRSKDEAFKEAKSKSQELREKDFKSACTNKKRKRHREQRLSQLANQSFLGMGEDFG